MSDDRGVILARRRRFLIVALAGVGCAGSPPTPLASAPKPAATTEPEPEPKPVAKPEPVDADADGVPDAEDRCPTAPGTSTPREQDDLGCPPRPCLMIVDTEIVVHEVVLFPPFAAKVSARAFPILDEIVRLLETHPDLDVEIEGHTQKGEPERVALARAKAIHEYISKKGIAADRSSVKSYGDTRPASSDATKNRRVSFRVQQRR